LFSVGKLTAVHALSLVLSISTLLILAPLVHGLGGRLSSRALCLMLAAGLPQFAMFCGYISNDTLAIFMGATIAWQVFRCLDKPQPKNHLMLAILLGLGLLTKGTFLVYIPVLILVLIVKVRRVGASPRNGWLTLTTFCLCVAVIGGYKFAQSWMV